MLVCVDVLHLDKKGIFMGLLISSMLPNVEKKGPRILLRRKEARPIKVKLSLGAQNEPKCDSGFALAYSIPVPHDQILLPELSLRNRDASFNQ